MKNVLWKPKNFKKTRMIQFLDRINNSYDLNSDKIKTICDRNFGIGSDGLIILKKSKIADFKMIYYNSNGQTSSLCGNGTRCLFSFSLSLGINKKRANNKKGYLPFKTRKL